MRRRSLFLLVAFLRAEFAHGDSIARVAEQPLSRGAVWATIAERDLVPEGTALDGVTRSVLVGSLSKHKIVAIARSLILERERRLVP